VWYSLEQVWWSECAASGFVLCECVCVSVYDACGQFGGGLAD